MADKFLGRGQSGLKRRTHHGHMADKVWRRGQSGLKADTSGHMTDKLQGCGQSISRPVFFLRENPTVNCLGNFGELGAGGPNVF